MDQLSFAPKILKRPACLAFIPNDFSKSLCHKRAIVKQ